MPGIENVVHTQLLKFPEAKAIALTPQLWLALGVTSYNHALLARQPLRILAPGEAIADLSKETWEALYAGKAAIVDTTGMSDASLAATAQITAALLKQLQVSVRTLGNAHTRKYLLLQFHGDDEASELTVPGPRILPVHDFPQAPQPEEAEPTGTDPKRRTP